MKSGTVSTMNYWNDSVSCEGGDSAGDSATRDDAIDGGGMVVQVGTEGGGLLPSSFLLGDLHVS